jgi:hypothetical protein
MRRFGLDLRAIRARQHRGHQARRAEALRDRVRLHVAIVVLASPDVGTVPFPRAGDHVIDQPMLVRQAALVELGLELVPVDRLEDITVGDDAAPPPPTHLSYRPAA